MLLAVADQSPQVEQLMDLYHEEKSPQRAIVNMFFKFLPAVPRLSSSLRR